MNIFLPNHCLSDSELDETKNIHTKSESVLGTSRCPNMDPVSR